MAEYIERETYRKRLANLEGWCQDLRKPGLKQALEMFDEIPAADVAPVVRCKDCKHLFGTICTVCGLLPRKPEDFCSYGERKDGGEADNGK
nr:MAG TPA: baseplate protein [Caudoviricetes sp.]